MATNNNTVSFERSFLRDDNRWAFRTFLSMDVQEGLNVLLGDTHRAEVHYGACGSTPCFRVTFKTKQGEAGTSPDYFMDLPNVSEGYAKEDIAGYLQECLKGSCVITGGKGMMSGDWRQNKECFEWTKTKIVL